MTEKGSSSPANPENIPSIRGSLRHISEGPLAAQLRKSLEKGEMKSSDFAAWLSEPWTSYEFLASRVSREEETVKTGPVPPDVLDTLRDWSDIAKVGAKEREQWETENSAKVEQARAILAALHAALSKRLETFDNTLDELRDQKDLNVVENVLRGTKEYVWDEFWDHPEMSAGLVIASYLAYKKIRKTRLWTGVKYGAAVVVGGAFLKDKFGVQPTEKIAEIAENLGQQGVADGIRTFRDTIKRGFTGVEGENSINGYYYDRLGLHRTNERIAFNHLLKQNPKEFVEWYDLVQQWRNSGEKKVPSGLRNQIREMSRGTPSAFGRLSYEERAELLLGVTDAVLKDIAVSNGAPESEQSPQKGLSILRAKYVDGTYFDTLWNRFLGPLTDLEKKYESPAIVEQLARVRAEAEEFFKGYKNRVVRGSDEISFMEVLYVEGSSDEMMKYGGAGLSFKELMDGLGDGWKKFEETMIALGEKGVEVAKEAGRIGMEYIKYLPEYWEEKWEKYGEPALEKLEMELADAWEELYDWYYDPDGVMQKAIAEAEKTGKDVYIYVKDSRIGQLVADLFEAAGEGVEMTLDMAKDFGTWISQKAADAKDARLNPPPPRRTNPGAQPQRTNPGGQPQRTNPGNQPPEQPQQRTNPGNQPQQSQQQRTNPGNQPQQQPRVNPGNQPAQQQQPRTNPGAQPPQQPQRTNPGNQPPEQPQQRTNPGNQPQQQPRVNPGNQPAQQQQPRTNPGSQPAQQQQPRNNPGARPQQAQQQRTNPGAQPGQQQRQRTNPGRNPNETESGPIVPGDEEGPIVPGDDENGPIVPGS